MADLHRQKHYRAATMGLVAYLDEHRVEMQIVTATGETVVIAFANDSIFKVERQIARMGRDCPEIATWGCGSEGRTAATPGAVAITAAASPRDGGTPRPQRLSLALMPALLLVLGLLVGGPAAADPLAGIQAKRFQFDQLVLGILKGGAAAFEPKILPQTERFQFSQWAKDHCPTDTVVWVNTRSHIYNSSDERWYGRTKGGAFVCKLEAEKAGYRAKPER